MAKKNSKTTDRITTETARKNLLEAIQNVRESLDRVPEKLKELLPVCDRYSARVVKTISTSQPFTLSIEGSAHKYRFRIDNTLELYPDDSAQIVSTTVTPLGGEKTSMSTTTVWANGLTINHEGILVVGS